MSHSDSSLNSSSLPALATLARVGKPYGLKGHLRLHVFSENPLSIFDFDRWFFRLPHQAWQPLSEAEFSDHGGHLLILFKQATSLELSRQFTHAELAVPEADLPVLSEPLSYYWRDLEGLQVINHLGQKLGKVSHLLETGANDVMVVLGEQERLIPFVRHFVQSVNLAEQTIYVEWELTW